MKNTAENDPFVLTDNANIPALYDLGLISAEELFEPLWIDTPEPEYQTAMSSSDKSFKRAVGQLLTEYQCDRLTLEEQKTYVPQIQAYVAIRKSIETSDNPSPEDLEVARIGIQARNELVLRTIPLAEHFVRQSMGFYKNKPDTKQLNSKIVADIANFASLPVDYDERLQIALENLIIAAEKYSGEHSFITAALWSLESRFMRLSGKQVNGGMVHVPHSVIRDSRKYDATKQDMTNVEGTAPTLYELAIEKGIDVEAAQKYERIASLMQPISLAVITNYLEGKTDPVLEQEDEDGLTVGDYLVDEGLDKTVEDEINFHNLGMHIDTAMTVLTEKEQHILELRFGFGLFEGVARSLEEVGREFGITRERTRQIEARSLARLRGPLLCKALRAYVDVGVDDPQYGMRAVLPITLDDDAALGIERPRAFTDQKPVKSPHSYAEMQKEETFRQLERRRDLVEKYGEKHVREYYDSHIWR